MPDIRDEATGRGIVAEISGSTMRCARRVRVRRGSALQHLAAWDVHRAKVFGRCEASTGIEPFGRLVDQVMRSEPYASARRVFWVVDNGSSDAGASTCTVTGPSVTSHRSSIRSCEVVQLLRALLQVLVVSVSQVHQRIHCSLVPKCEGSLNGCEPAPGGRGGGCATFNIVRRRSLLTGRSEHLPEG